MITLALMAGTAGLPHIISRFFTVPKIRDARASAGWALVFIGLLYTAAPAVAAFARAGLPRDRARRSRTPPRPPGSRAGRRATSPPSPTGTATG